MLIDNQGYQATDADILSLKGKYTAQALEIDHYAKAAETYIIDLSSSPGKIVFHELQEFQDKRDSSRLKRTAFSSDTQKAVALPKGAGYHRRHIISNHLMKLAIDNWQKAHPGDMTLKQAEALLDKVNNYQPNLIPGPGAENSAIGMMTNRAAGIQKGASGFTGSMSPEAFSASLGANMGFYSGFQQQKQAELVDPVLPAFHDPKIAGSHGSAMSFAKDIEVSTDFDWPEDADPSLHGKWYEIFQRFHNVKDNPANWEPMYFKMLIQEFLKLPKPTP